MYIINLFLIFYWLGSSILCYVSFTFDYEEGFFKHNFTILPLCFLWPILFPLALTQFVTQLDFVSKQIKNLEMSNMNCVNYKMWKTGNVPQCVPAGWIICNLGQNPKSGTWSCSLLNVTTWEIVTTDHEYSYMTEAISKVSEKTMGSIGN